MKNRSKTLKEIFVEAFTYYRKNKLKNAEMLCYKILSIDENHFDSISLLATISATNGNYMNAEELMKKAVELQPDNTSALNNLGTAYKEQGKINDAVAIYKKLLEINPNHVNANYNLGLAHYTVRNHFSLIEAKKYLKKTVEIQSNFALAFFSLANVHVELKEYKEALSCYHKSIDINPNLASTYNNLGLLYRELNDYTNAIDSYEKAIKTKSNHASAHHNLGQIYKEKGEFKKSIKSHEMAIKCEPDNLMNYHFLSELKKDILDNSLKKKIEKIIKNSKANLVNLAYGNYLLAKYEQNNKNYEKEINYLELGHKSFFNSRKQKFNLGLKYCFDDVLQIEKNVYVKKSTEKSSSKIKPIFIFGVPRSGSTLVERIIASGKKYIPIGEETGIIGDYVPKKVLEKHSLNLGDSNEILSELCDLYKNKGLILEKYNYTFTDKSLDNFFYLKLIKEIFPNAKIINCKRNMLASIVSIFQNNLTSLAWTHDLDNIFKYFDNYLQITKNFDKEFPNTIYELEFEKLIENQEIESKKLMKYCELDWDKKCLEFHKRKDLPSKTASSIQVRKAIYKHAAEKYMPYKKILNKYGKKYSWFN